VINKPAKRSWSRLFVRRHQNQAAGIS
jgi:hypothetical protein